MKIVIKKLTIYNSISLSLSKMLDFSKLYGHPEENSYPLDFIKALINGQKIIAKAPIEAQ